MLDQTQSSHQGQNTASCSLFHQHDTKAALAAAKASGNIKGQGFLGNPCFKNGEQIPGSGNTQAANKARSEKADAFARDMAAVIRNIQSVGVTKHRQIALKLNDEGYETSRSGKWQATSVARIIKRAKGL